MDNKEKMDIEEFVTTEKGKKIVEAAVIVLETAIFALGVLLIIVKTKGYALFPVVAFALMKILEIIFLGNDRKHPERPIIFSSLAILIGSVLVLGLGKFILPEAARMSSLVLAFAWVIPSVFLINVFNFSFMLLTSIARSLYHCVTGKTNKKEEMNENKNKDVNLKLKVKSNKKKVIKR